MLASLAYRDATLEQQSANLVDQRGAAHASSYAEGAQTHLSIYELGFSG